MARVYVAQVGHCRKISRQGDLNNPPGCAAWGDGVLRRRLGLQARGQGNSAASTQGSHRGMVCFPPSNLRGARETRVKFRSLSREDSDSDSQSLNETLRAVTFTSPGSPSGAPTRESSLRGADIQELEAPCKVFGVPAGIGR